MINLCKVGKHDKFVMAALRNELSNKLRIISNNKLRIVCNITLSIALSIALSILLSALLCVSTITPVYAAEAGEAAKIAETIAAGDATETAHAKTTGDVAKIAYVRVEDLLNGVTLIPRTEVHIGGTAMDALMSALTVHGYDPGSEMAEQFGYVSSLFGLGGEYTAWMFTLNDSIPAESLAETIIEDGDELVMFHMNWNDPVYVTVFSSRSYEITVGWTFYFPLYGALTMDFFETDDTDFTPIENALIYIYDESGEQVGKASLTNEFGFVGISVNKIGKYTIVAKRPGAVNATDLVPAIAFLDVLPGETTDNTNSYFASYNINGKEVTISSDDGWVCPYTDVVDEGQNISTIRIVIDSGLMFGTEESLFEPDASVTRAMFFTVLHRYENCPAPKTLNAFIDVEDGQWYTDAVVWAQESGITVGYGDGRFGVNDQITAEQMATVLANYSRYKGIEISVDDEMKTAVIKNDSYTEYQYKDEISDWALIPMEWAVSLNLLKNKIDKSIFEPQHLMTRMETASVIVTYALMDGLGIL